MQNTIVLFIAFLIAGIVSLSLSKQLKQHKNVFYIVSWVTAGITFAVMIGLTVFRFSGKYSDELRGFFHSWFALPHRLIAGGFLAAAFWVFVMFANYVPSRVIKGKLMANRTELSIIATIFSLPQAVLNTPMIFPFLINQFKKDGFSAHLSLNIAYVFAAIILIVTFVLLVILGWTSSERVRAKMGMAKWKRLHKWAYVFYFLSFFQWILVAVLRSGYYRDKSMFEFYLVFVRVAFYAIVYVLYLIFKYSARSKAKRSA